MKNQNPEIVAILDEKDLKFQCKSCGEIWWPNIRPGGSLHYGSWQCPRGCKPGE